MQIEDLKRWHWIVIGLAAGLVLSYLYASIEPGSRGDSMAQERFERFVTNRPYQGEHPWLTDVKVYPDRDGMTVVTGYYLEPGRNLYNPFRFISQTPYQPLARIRDNRPPDWEQSEQQTVRKYLEHHAAEREHLSVRYMWTHEPRFIYMIWTGAAVAIIGGIWPTIIGLLTAAGMGRRRAAEPEYDLDRFKGGDEPELQPQQKREVTQEDIDQLAAVEAELQRRLAAHGGDEPPAAAEQETTEQPIRQLDGRPLEHAAQQQAEDERRSYAGEFYPTVAHVPKSKKE
jgi:hypothetical protein